MCLSLAAEAYLTYSLNRSEQHITRIRWWNSVLTFNQKVLNLCGYSGRSFALLCCIYCIYGHAILCSAEPAL